MKTKCSIILLLLFTSYPTLAEESTRIHTDFVDLTFTVEDDKDLDESDAEEEDLEEDADVEEEESEENKAAETVPNGEPVENGQLSSEYGWRKDPFTGQHKHHAGIDIAADHRSDVKAVSPGTVTRAGKHGSYGNLVEIDHGNEYKTRYGHNDEILVLVGDKVKKGDTIALVGSTGRSTGPHLHYEVLHRDTKVDPGEFLEPKPEEVPVKEEREREEIDEDEEDEVYEAEVFEDEIYEAEVFEDELYEDEDEVDSDDQEES